MRLLLIKVHLYLAAFFAPMLLIMAISGGGYLIGFKGIVATSQVELTAPVTISSGSADLEGDFRRLLAANGIAHEFEYLRVAGDKLITRPTSSDYYSFDLSGNHREIVLNQPDFQKTLVELHKGHGPLLFKDLQKVMAAGLLVMVLSGLWLGLTAVKLRTPTIITTAFGLLVFLALASA